MYICAYMRGRLRFPRVTPPLRPRKLALRSTMPPGRVLPPSVPPYVPLYVPHLSAGDTHALALYIYIYIYICIYILYYT